MMSLFAKAGDDAYCVWVRDGDGGGFLQLDGKLGSWRDAAGYSATGAMTIRSDLGAGAYVVPEGDAANFRDPFRHAPAWFGCGVIAMVVLGLLLAMVG